ncbi:aldehyde dehydrogenase family protein, partial [Clostridium perfringens]|nr:aldehyde dehydrogenase family protein [Clostridium perfringens]
VSYGKIINTRHLGRLNDLVRDAVAEGAKIEIGGLDSNSPNIEPVVVTNVNVDSALMQEEIFGPVLPLINYNDLSEAITFINKRPKPLALYIF